MRPLIIIVFFLFILCCAIGKAPEAIAFIFILLLISAPFFLVIGVWALIDMIIDRRKRNS